MTVRFAKKESRKPSHEHVAVIQKPTDSLTGNTSATDHGTSSEVETTSHNALPDVSHRPENHSQEEEASALKIHLAS